MVLRSGCILVLMWNLRHDFSGHYNRLALISVDIISGFFCSPYEGKITVHVVRTQL